MNAIYALYEDADAAQRAVNGLLAAGVAERDITIMSGDPIEGHELGERDAMTWMPWIAAFGGCIGLLFGTWLTSMVERAWPLTTGNMPIVTWWPNLIIMFELTMFGGIVSTVITLIVTAGLARRRPKLHDPEIGEGKILIGVQDPPQESVADVERALLAGGASRLKTVTG